LWEACVKQALILLMEQNRPGLKNSEAKILMEDIPAGDRDVMSFKQMV
jgi:hypothetical protein